ncbi:uncharacterized protein LOC112348244 [Selaginella moellendorffii]|uniref:uncharacterized protein LOC112348244 n=1 Tax=Selaginella moellendorffii TaxID=88036 RepID=UPI000D1CF9C3|nr:uncharacterized protein LOC112348244 [Selaginella moellendorffii]|eukprot:XP_024536178.1 uncharacterized protein LOC112348244 [Selaginella moellendorffii]
MLSSSFRRSLSTLGSFSPLPSRGRLSPLPGSLSADLRRTLHLSPVYRTEILKPGVGFNDLVNARGIGYAGAMSKFVAKAARAHEEEAAAMDVHECVCIDAMIAKWHAEDPDETLFLVLALCYIARLSDAERSACAATLGWDGARAQMDCMVDFARRVLLSRTPTLDSLEASRQDEEVTEHLERLWSAFCRERNMKVCSKEVARTDIDMDFFPAEPYRKPCNGEFRWRCKGDVEEKWDIKFSPLSTTFAGEVPKLLDLVSKVVNSDFFFFHPVDNMGWNMRSVVRDQARRDQVKLVYSLLAGHRVPPPWPFVEMDGVMSAPLRVKELVLLLEGIHNNKLLRSLALERPPLSVLPHYHAISVCTQHARIWLGRYDLRIYYDHKLTYGRLGTQDSSTQEEEEVLANGFYKERTPSFMEKAVRICTMGEMWVSSSEKEEAWLMNMWPEDYDLAKPPDTAMWRAYRQYVGHPVVVPKEQSKIGAARVLSDIDYEYTRYLGWETKSKHSEDGLFPLPVPTLHEIL